MKIGLKKIVIGSLIGLLAAAIFIVFSITFLEFDNENLFVSISFWVVCGIFSTTVDLKMNKFIRGVLVSLLCLTPFGEILYEKYPDHFVFFILITIILGSFVGLISGNFNNKQNRAIRSGRIYRQRRK